MTVRRVGPRTWKRWLNGGIPLSRVLGIHRDVQEEVIWEATRRLDEGDVSHAETLFDLVAILWPESTLGPLGVGVCRMKQDRHAEAVDQFHLAERLDGSNPYTLANLAECAMIQGDPETASKLLDRIDRSDDKRKAELSARLVALREVVSTTAPPLV